MDELLRLCRAEPYWSSFGPARRWGVIERVLRRIMPDGAELLRTSDTARKLPEFCDWPDEGAVLVECDNRWCLCVDGRIVQKWRKWHHLEMILPVLHRYEKKIGRKVRVEP
jgi:hypothetical protein